MALAFFGLLLLQMFAFLSAAQVGEHTYMLLVAADYKSTQLHIYSWPSSSDRSLVAPNETVSPIFPSLLSQYFQAARTNSLDSMLVFALNLVTTHLEQITTPLFFKITSSLRFMISDAELQAVTMLVQKELKVWPFKFQSSEVLMEQHQAVLTWVSVNFALDHMISKDTTKDRVLGSVCVDAGDAYVVFKPNTTTIEHDDGIEVNLLTKKEFVFAHSYNGFGLEHVWHTLISSLVKISNQTKAIDFPCLPTAVTSLHSPFGDWNAPILLHGTGNESACKTLVDSLFISGPSSSSASTPAVVTALSSNNNNNISASNSDSGNNCPFSSCSFDGSYIPPIFGEFIVWPVSNIWGCLSSLTELTTLGDLDNEAARVLSSSSSTESNFEPHTAFVLYYTAAFLRRGLNFSDEQVVRLTAKVPNAIGGNVFLGWPLGAIVLEASNGLYPLSKLPAPQQFARNRWLVGCVIFIFILAVLAIGLSDFLSCAEGETAQPTKKLSPTSNASQRQAHSYRSGSRPTSFRGGQSLKAMASSSSIQHVPTDEQCPLVVGFQFFSWERLNRLETYGRQKLSWTKNNLIIPPFLSLSATDTTEMESCVSIGEVVPLLCEADFEAEALLQRTYQADVPRATFIVCNIYIGLALLSMPYAINCMGWILVPCLAVFVVLGNYTAKLLSRCFRRVNVAYFAESGGDTYGNLAYTCLGAKYQIACFLLQLLTWFGIGVVCLTVLLNTFQSFFPQSTKRFCFLITAVSTFPSVIAPPCTTHRFALRYLWSIQTVVVVVVMAIVGMNQFLQIYPTTTTINNNNEFWISSSSHQKFFAGGGGAAGKSCFSPAIALGVIFFALSGHSCVAALRRSLPRPDLEKALNYAFGIIFLVYGLMATCGYFAFRYATVKSNSPLVTLYLREDFPQLEIIWVIVSSFVAFNVFLAVPSVIDVVCGLCSDAFRLPVNDNGNIESTVLRLCCLGCSLLACFVCEKNLALLEAFIGGACGTFMTFIFPLLFHVNFKRSEMSILSLVLHSWLIVMCGVCGLWIALTCLLVTFSNLML